MYKRFLNVLLAGAAMAALGGCGKQPSATNTPEMKAAHTLPAHQVSYSVEYTQKSVKQARKMVAKIAEPQTRTMMVNYLDALDEVGLEIKRSEMAKDLQTATASFLAKSPLREMPLVVKSEIDERPAFDDQGQRYIGQFIRIKLYLPDENKNPVPVASFLFDIDKLHQPLSPANAYGYSIHAEGTRAANQGQAKQIEKICLQIKQRPAPRSHLTQAVCSL